MESDADDNEDFNFLKNYNIKGEYQILVIMDMNIQMKLGLKKIY